MQVERAGDLGRGTRFVHSRQLQTRAVERRGHLAQVEAGRYGEEREEDEPQGPELLPDVELRAGLGHRCFGLLWVRRACPARTAATPPTTRQAAVFARGKALGWATSRGWSGVRGPGTSWARSSGRRAGSRRPAGSGGPPPLSAKPRRTRRPAR